MKVTKGKNLLRQEDYDRNNGIAVHTKKLLKSTLKMYNV